MSSGSKFIDSGYTPVKPRTYDIPRHGGECFYTGSRYDSPAPFIKQRTAEAIVFETYGGEPTPDTVYSQTDGLVYRTYEAKQTSQIKWWPWPRRQHYKAWYLVEEVNHRGHNTLSTRKKERTWLQKMKDKIWNAFT